MQTDYPKTRAGTVCPCCELDKPKGNIVCWPCYRLFNGCYGFSEHVLEHLEHFEAMQ